MNSALMNRFLKLMSEANRRVFESNQLAVDPELTFFHYFDYFWKQFENAMEKEVIENTAKLLNSWQPHEGMEVLIGRFDQTQICAFFTKDLLYDTKEINYFLTV